MAECGQPADPMDMLLQLRVANNARALAKYCRTLIANDNLLAFRHGHETQIARDWVECTAGACGQNKAAHNGIVSRFHAFVRVGSVVTLEMPPPPASDLAA